MKKTYSDVIQIPSFEDRIEFLMTHNAVGKETFGYNRYLNQLLYQLPEWRKVRRNVIIRDNSCDLAHPEHEIHPYGRKSVILVHHIVPITKEDILERTDLVLDPSNLITVSHKTHEIIHYGYKDNRRPMVVVERKPFDTCPWRN